MVGGTGRGRKTDELADMVVVQIGWKWGRECVCNEEEVGVNAHSAGAADVRRESVCVL